MRIISGIVLILSLLIIFSGIEQNAFAQTREEASEASKEYTKTNPELRSSESAKIHSMIIEWKNSLNPEAFARDNNIIFSDNKIQVYIYLDSAESITNIPQEISVLDSDDNVVFAFVSSEQINELSQSDFVIQISPPDNAIPREVQREPIKEILKSNDSKIESLILEWVESSNQKTFAEKNSLIFSDNKIQVYIYLDSAESITNIPQEISVLDSDDNVVFAFVSSEQINELSQSDFVIKISKPIEARIPSIPILEDEENAMDIGMEIPIIVGIIIIIGIIAAVYSKKRK